VQFKFKDKKGVDPRLIARRRARGLPDLPPPVEEDFKIVYPGRIRCEACGQKITISPYFNPADALKLHQAECRRFKREIIVVRSGVR